jgi:Leu/Phe-tRNA-protein transferase
MIFMDPGDDCGAVVDAMLDTGYAEEFCLALDWDPDFISRLMKAGFLVMSDSFRDEENRKRDIVLPKLHLVRSVLFFPRLHVKKSIRRFLNRYELRFDTDFERIVGKCLDTHGDGWLSAALVRSLFALRKKSPEPEAGGQGPVPRPVSFGVYRDGELRAGEFGVICGRVYTSYSGYKEEDNAGTVQMILMVRWLENEGFDFLDFGMPLEYKTGLGAQNLTPAEFVTLWRKAQTRQFPVSKNSKEKESQGHIYGIGRRA